MSLAAEVPQPGGFFVPCGHRNDASHAWCIYFIVVGVGLGEQNRVSEDNVRQCLADKCGVELRACEQDTSRPFNDMHHDVDDDEEYDYTEYESTFHKGNTSRKGKLYMRPMTTHWQGYA